MSKPLVGTKLITSEVHMFWYTAQFLLFEFRNCRAQFDSVLERDITRTGCEDVDWIEM